MSFDEYLGAVQATKAVVSVPIPTSLLRDMGPLPGDEEQYADRVRPYRNGILSERRLRDKRVSRARLIEDSKALRHALRWASEDLVDFKEWGDHLAGEAAKLRARIEEVFSYLTQEERERVWRMSEESRKGV